MSALRCRASRTPASGAPHGERTAACLGAPRAVLPAATAGVTRRSGSGSTPHKPLRRAALVVLCTLGLSACQRTVTPQQTAERYAEAIEGDDAAAARELFSDDLRERRPDARLDAEFERRVEAGAPMREALEHAAESPASLSAQLAYADIERLDMELVGDSWQIVDGVLAPQPFATPRDALLGLVRALDTQNPELLYQLMPPDFRYETSLDALTAWMESEAAAIADTVQLLRRHIEDPMSVSEDRALLRYGARTLVLHRAANRWFVWDFD